MEMVPEVKNLPRSLALELSNIHRSIWLFFDRKLSKMPLAHQNSKTLKQFPCHRVHSTGCVMFANYFFLFISLVKFAVVTSNVNLLLTCDTRRTPSSSGPCTYLTANFRHLTLLQGLNVLEF